MISGKEFHGCRCGVGNAPLGSSKGSRTDWLGKQKGRLKSAVEGQDSRYQNLGSGPRVSEFVGGSLLPLPAAGGQSLSCSSYIPGAWRSVCLQWALSTCLLTD